MLYAHSVHAVFVEKVDSDIFLFKMEFAERNVFYSQHKVSWEEEIPFLHVGGQGVFRTLKLWIDFRKSIKKISPFIPRKSRNKFLGSHPMEFI